MKYSMDDIFSLKNRYQNGDVQIGSELIQPCLSLCNHYRRGTGFFSSSALKAYVSAIDNIINDKIKIDILCSPVIHDKGLIKILDNNKNESDKQKTIRKLSEKIVLIAAGFELNPENYDYRSKLLAFMIANNQLEIRFALPNHFDWPTEEPNERNLYHVKMGYFEFDDGTRVAFDGSFNESESGHNSHVDRAHVFRSWIESDEERLTDTISDINSDWGDDVDKKNPKITVFKLSNEALDIIRKLSPAHRPLPPRQTHNRETSSGKNIQLPDGIWEHKRKAITTFIKSQHGILEMATGTGKTSTALEIIRYLYLTGEIETIIISTYGTDLLNQWHKEIQKWQHKYSVDGLSKIKIFRSYEKHKESMSFLNDNKDSILLISREAEGLKRVLNATNICKEKTIVIHDEIHGFGSNSMLKALKGAHQGYKYTLGLSATPEREYDETGTKFIETEVGPVIFEYPVEEAIKSGILCEFDYEPLSFELTINDKGKYKSIFARKANDERNGNPWPEERLAIELSKIVKKAELKPHILNDYLRANSQVLKSCIIFVLDREQGDSICNVISKYTSNYRTYYAGTDKEHLNKLASNKLDCLVACERLNEGVDIQALQNIILIASPKKQLDTIQRIGRCLRRNPDDDSKIATVVDFVLEEPDEEDGKNDDQSDSLRKKWLESLSNVRRITK
jgi:superfamily II DNA or RNA helicase